MTPGETETGITTLIGQLVGDARELAVAEVGVLKARAGETVGRYRGAAIFFGAAGALGFGGFIALLIGLILTLTPHTGPGIATLIVVGVVIVVAAILGLIGKSKLASRSAVNE
ncbi:phage holin family protein [Sphingomonas sp. SUN019]|uniref:phage holin family protein n=1 Tax=Sphingomonas sp. SUN019 TaxID=2937788 RepID=UPI0021649E0D|nr:phage holin family protein [Sphingomonas sp. SUN019]UVO49333.1 phage holin family protein [Sphingomonas sp. SUN019]